MHILSLRINQKKCKYMTVHTAIGPYRLHVDTTLYQMHLDHIALVNKTTMIFCSCISYKHRKWPLPVTRFEKKLKRKGVALQKDKNRGSVDFYEDDDIGETKQCPFFTKSLQTFNFLNPLCS